MQCQRQSEQEMKNCDFTVNQKLNVVYEHWGFSSWYHFPFFFLIAVNLMWDKLNPINNYLPFNIFGINKQKASTKHIIYFPKISLLF